VADGRTGMLELWKLGRCCVSHRKQKRQYKGCRLTIDGTVHVGESWNFLVAETLKALLCAFHDLVRAHAVEVQAVMLYAATLCTVKKIYLAVEE